MTSTSAIPATCELCGKLRGAALTGRELRTLCEHVRAADYFEVFGLPRAYRIDTSMVQRVFRDISRNIHPDAFATEVAEVQGLSLQLSAAVNTAFDALRDPVRRADYLLGLVGGKSAAEDKRVPADLLANTMMLREEIEEARAAGDSAALTAMRPGVESQRAEALRKITELAERLPDLDGPSRDELRMRLNSMKYFDNLLAQL